jgi:hypothetical protein
VKGDVRRGPEVDKGIFLYVLRQYRSKEDETEGKRLAKEGFRQHRSGR